MIVSVLCVVSEFTIAVNSLDQPQIEKYSNDAKVKKFQLEVPGKEPITIIETASSTDESPEWIDISVGVDKEKDSVEVKNFMTDVIHDTNSHKSRCYGPSCQEGFDENLGPQGNLEDYLAEHAEIGKDYRDYSKDRLEAINDLAARLKKDKTKTDRYTSYDNVDYEDEPNGNVYTAWNRLKVKQHKHPFDDKDGWITLEPVAWSTSKISKWKPNIKKYRPAQYNDDNYSSDEKYVNHQPTNNQFKRPNTNRPTYINNKLHVSSPSLDWDAEVPSKPSWNKPSYSYPSSWKPDGGRRPTKPNCDADDNYPSDDTVFYGMSDSVVTDGRPSHFPYEYEALKRPIRRPTQVVYAGSPEYDSDRESHPPHGDGQWVLLSTTKGYRNKKRQRSMTVDENSDPLTITSHQAVALTVLPVDNKNTNMTTSHGGLLEVERSFQTVEESKRDMDKKNSYEPENSLATVLRPVVTQSNKVFKRKIYSSGGGPDGSTVLAAVGAGMVPATMAMMVPMMLGRRKRDISRATNKLKFNDLYYRYE